MARLVKFLVIFPSIFISITVFAQNGGQGMESIKLAGEDKITNENLNPNLQPKINEKNIKESEMVDFNSIKDILKNDNLEGQAKKVEATAKKEKKKKQENRKNLYNIPGEDDFWNFISEYWLVKNAPVLRWDFQHPDYGLEETFELLLEKYGFFEKKFKILLVNTTTVPHVVLPSDGNGTIILFSDPFMKFLDLSKMEITLLMLQDYLRERMGQFKEKVMTKEISGLIGSNFEGKSLNTQIFDGLLKNYDQVLFKKGFTFQEQYDVTKEMERLLKGEPQSWKVYIALLKKLDGLVKTDNHFKDYAKIYPSPELQLSWLGEKIQNK